MMKLPRLIFFGSGPVGKATLEGLTAAGFSFEAIITKPPTSRHHVEMPVPSFSTKNHIAIYTPANEAELLEIFKTKKFESRLGLVVDYGIYIPKAVIDSFELGIINSHFSLLPEWRGPDPITFAILSGQKRTGVSLMLIDHKIDTGKLLAQANYDISPAENIITLTENLVELSNKTLIEMLPLYIGGEVVLVDQDTSAQPTYSRRLTKDDGLIDFKKPAARLEREVRAYLGWPKSRAKVHGHDVIITQSRVANTQNDGDLVIKASPGWLEIQRLTAPSGRSISGAEFLRGYNK